MSISRRKFLGTGTLALIATGLPAHVLAGESLKKSAPRSKSSRRGGEQFDSETFSRYLNTNFRMRSSNTGVVSVKLVEVSHWSESKAGKECFSVVFLGSGSRRLRQDTYTVEHEELGKFPLLIVPSGKVKRGFYYEAVFNRTR
jgi:hypothetical protein